MSKRSNRPQSGVEIQDEFDEALLAADRLVQEYLAFRGFTETLVSFEAERSGDKKHTFNAKAIVKRIFKLVSSHDALALMKLWSFMETRFFKTLRDEWQIAQTFKKNLMKYFVTTCIKDGRKEIALTFLKNICSTSSSSSSSWREWFALPFMENPEKDSSLGIYFDAVWIKHFHDSLVNFLASLFRRLPLPHIMNFRVAYIDHQRMSSELEACKAEVLRLQRREKLQRAELESLRDSKIFSPASLLSPKLRSSDEDYDVDSSSKHDQNREFCLGWSHCLSRHSSAVTCLDTLVSEGDVMLLSGSSDATAQLWRLCRNEPMKNEEDYEEKDEEDDNDNNREAAVDALDRHSHRSTLFCSGAITTLKWAPSNVRPSSSSSSTSKEKRSRGGYMFLVGTEQQELQLWYAHSQGRRLERFRDIAIPDETPRVMDVAWKDDGSSRFAAALSPAVTDVRQHGGGTPFEQSVVSVWDLTQTKKPIGTHKVLGGPSPLSVLEFVDDLIIAGGADGMIRVLDSNTGKWILQKVAFDESSVQAIQFVPSKRSLLLTNGTGSITQWDMRMLDSTLQIGSSSRVFRMRETTCDSAIDNEMLSSGQIKTSIVMGNSKDESNYFLAGSNHGVAGLFDIRDNTLGSICMLHGGHTGAILSMSWIPQRQIVATASSDCTVRLWNLSRS